MMSITSTDREFADLLLDPKSLEQGGQHSIRSQVIVTEYLEQTLIFPSAWVDEVPIFSTSDNIEAPVLSQASLWHDSPSWRLSAVD